MMIMMRGGGGICDMCALWIMPRVDLKIIGWLVLIFRSSVLLSPLLLCVRFCAHIRTTADREEQDECINTPNVFSKNRVSAVKSQSKSRNDARGLWRKLDFIPLSENSPFISFIRSVQLLKFWLGCHATLIRERGERESKLLASKRSCSVSQSNDSWEKNSKNCLLALLSSHFRRMNVVVVAARLEFSRP